ncbi:hypothetical protein [Streptomyces wuyuanensis]|uniref:Uncharacterized protein n=1 Tax=Streptomyces wuyuanensis TaxID=1196353 RepID=A0A1G9PV46_9ACTN|nr:hypothetical protein [Streptomyces wuyuanensis]SDM01985.1 hypothetical protein SAMN05444921_10350 [Streptomyces wuyuanensis]
MDLDSVADELYRLPPERFVEARGRQAAAARKAGDRALAGRITALRRPTLSAWASNLLVRSEPDRAAELLRLGESLRQAVQELDRDRMRELGARRNRLVGALSRHVGELSGAAGRPLGETTLREIESTLQAVLADSDAAEQWAAGRLARPLTPPVGFTGAAVAGAARRPAPAAGPDDGAGSAAGRDGDGGTLLAEPAKRAPKEPRGGRAAAEPRRERPGKEQRERTARKGRGDEHLREHARARREAEAADRLAHELEDELRRAESEREDAGTRLKQAKEAAAAVATEVAEAQERLRTLRERLDEAEAGVDPARAALETARERVTDARRAARQARRRARTAADLADRFKAGS